MVRAHVLVALLALLPACGQAEAPKAPVPSPPAAPQPLARSCAEVERAAETLAQQVSACTTDADCRAQPLPGGCPPAYVCHLFINVSSDAEAVRQQARALSQEYG